MGHSKRVNKTYTRILHGAEPAGPHDRRDERPHVKDEQHPRAAHLCPGRAKALVDHKGARAGRARDDAVCIHGDNEKQRPSGSPPDPRLAPRVCVPPVGEQDGNVAAGHHQSEVVHPVPVPDARLFVLFGVLCTQTAQTG